jgi:hypothetical protein
MLCLGPQARREVHTVGLHYISWVLEEDYSIITYRSWEQYRVAASAPCRNHFLHRYRRI